MVDRTSLEILGFILGGVTALVIAIAVIVVRSHVGARIATEQAASSISAPQVVPAQVVPAQVVPAQVVPASLSAQR